MKVPVSRITWLPCFRILPSRFPPIELFERVADPADRAAVIEVESLTHPGIRDALGALRLVPPEDRLSGPGTRVIMAAFTHLNPAGSRFSDGRYGVFYAGRDLQTAVAETRYHRERFMRATHQGRTQLDMRVYLTDLEGALHDLRGLRASLPAVYPPADSTGGQQLARALRAQGAWGIAYDSVRHEEGECAAVFRPPVLSNCRAERHLCYVWDGERVSRVYEKRELL